MTRNDLLQAIIDGKKFEYLNNSAQAWRNCHDSYVLAGLANDTPPSNYRIKPETVMINDYEVPAPLRVAPAMGTLYWYERASGSDFTSWSEWDDHTFDRMLLARGIMHATKEAAAASCKARLGIDPNKE